MHSQEGTSSQLAGRERYTRHFWSVAQNTSCPIALSTSKDSIPLHSSLYTTDTAPPLLYCCCCCCCGCTLGSGDAPVDTLPKMPPLVQNSTAGSGAAAALCGGSYGSKWTCQ